MKKEDKELLLRDLCGRLPYGVKILHQGWNYEWDQELSTLEKVIGIDERFIYTKVINDKGEEYTSDRHIISLFDDKPYLFPLSSMTEEQNKELHDKLIELELKALNDEISRIEAVSFEIDYYLKNHFDYRGLIEKGLAIDATGLNIYKEKTK